MKEIEESVTKLLSKNPEYEKQLQHHSNNLYRISLGRPISEQQLIKKTGFEPENLKILLVALISSGNAIRIEHEDGVPRYQITSKPEIHLKFLRDEEKFLKERLDWVLEKIQQFESELKPAK